MSKELTYTEVEELAKQADIYGVVPGATYIFVFQKDVTSMEVVRRFMSSVHTLTGTKQNCCLRLLDKDGLKIFKVADE